MADMNAGTVNVEVRATSNKLAADMAAAKAKLATSATSIEKSLNIGQALRGMNGMSAMLPGVGGQFASVASNVAGMGASLGAVGIAASAAATAIVAVTVAAGALGKAAVEAASARQDLLLSFEILLKSKDAAKDLVGQMQKLADTTPLETAGIADAGRLLLAMRFDVKDIIPMITKMGDAMVVSGRGQEGLMHLALVLGQIKSAGRLLGQDVLQLNQLGLNPRAAVAKDMGVSEEEVRKRMEAGTISSAVAIKAIFRDITENAGGAMDKLSKGWNGRMSTLHDAWNALLVKIGTPIIDALSPMLVTAATWLSKLGDAFAAKLPDIIAFFGRMKEAYAPLFLSFKIIFDSVAKIVTAMAPVTTLIYSILGYINEIRARLFSLVALGLSEVFSLYATVWSKILETVTAVARKIAEIMGLTDSTKPTMFGNMAGSAIKAVQAISAYGDKLRNVANAAMAQAKEQAATEATAVIDGLKKQFEAHQEYINKLKGIYARMAGASAGVRSRMVVTNVDNVGKAKPPDFESMRSGLERGSVVRQLGDNFTSQYEKSAGSIGGSIGKNVDPRELIKELKQMNQTMFKLLWQTEVSSQKAVLS